MNKIIDTAEFQRLKYISQLGLSYFTYPDALHSRFSHSLGTYWLSKRLARTLELPEKEEEMLSIAALLHDIGHAPFSHTLEDKIMPGKKHEGISKEVIESGEHSISTILK
ncbi:MAG: HD domain-containing protein, partial [Halobacteriota archaeon]|nr:HD domain-containing protein [Halobacteriota archaeon]